MLSQKAWIKDLDLSYVEKRLIDRKKYEPTDAKEAVRRYKNFLLLLIKYPGKILAPAPDMDEAWHAHILFTREYFRDSEQIFGEYLHHSPAQDGEASAMIEAQTETAALYMAEFKEPFYLELNVSSFW